MERGYVGIRQNGRVRNRRARIPRSQLVGALETGCRSPYTSDHCRTGKTGINLDPGISTIWGIGTVRGIRIIGGRGLENRERKMSLADFTDQSRKTFAEFWAARDARERAMLAAAAAVVALALFYALLIAPALTGRERSEKNLPLLRQQVAQLQALAKQAKTLATQPESGNLATAPGAMTKEMIEAALTRNGLKPKSVTLSGDFAKVQLAAVSFAGTLTWLNNMQTSAQITVIDAHIVALALPDSVDATLTLRQRSNE